MGTYTTGWTQYRLVMDFTDPDLHALEPRERHRRLDAAQGRGRHRLRHPDALGLHRQRHPRHAVEELLRRADVGRRHRLLRLGHHRPADTTPRPCRRGLSATPGTAQVALSWSANTEPDLAGYNVYRDGVKLDGAPIPDGTPTPTRPARRRHLLLPRQSAVDTTGNESARCAAVSATVGTVTPPTGATLVDAGFESGADATALDPASGRCFGAPARAEYDTARAKIGTLSAWIQGTAATAYTGVYRDQDRRDDL